MSAAPPPNWYADPQDAARLRWWDGNQWTNDLHALVPLSPADGGEALRTEPQQPATTFERTSAAPVPVPLPMTLPGPAALPPRDRRPMFVGAAVIAVLLIGVIAYVLSRGGDDDGDIVSQAPTTTAATATTTVATTRVATTSVATTSVATTLPPSTTRPPATTTAALAGSTFSDPTNVYRLRIGPTWQDATVVGGLQTWSTGTSSSTFRDSVNVFIEKLSGDISIEDYLAASVKNAPKSLPSFVEVGRSVNTVNGKVLGQLDYRSNQLRYRVVVLIKGRNAIVVTFTSEPARFDAEVVKVQPYLTSIEGA